MIHIIYSPQWFYGKDIIIDIISIIVLALIAIQARSYYRLSDKKSFHYFSGAFLLIALAFVFKILTNFTLYYNVLETRNIGFAVLTYRTIRASDALFDVGFLLYRIFTLVGLYFLFAIRHRQSRSTSILVVFLLISLTYFSQDAFYVFYATCLLLLILVTIEYIKGWRIAGTARLVGLGFTVITASQLLFILVSESLIFYPIAEGLQLLGYLALLISFLKVRYGKTVKN